MKNTFLSITLILALLSACTSDTKQSTTTAAETASSTPVQTEGFAAALQGTWNRATYPFGTVTFQDAKVKIEAGEGARKSATFESYRLADSCPFSLEEADKAIYLDFLVMEDTKTCTAIRIANDTLILGDATADLDIRYTRAADTASLKATEYTIPESIQGTWAEGTGNCDSRNPNQITVDSRSVQFFENNAQLLEITEYEPTRVFGRFTYKKSGGNTIPYRLILDAQQDGKVLIIRQYGEDSPPGLVKYERCK